MSHPFRSTRPVPDDRPRQPPVEVVTMTAERLARIVEEAAERGYLRAAAERDRAVGRLADRLALPQHRNVLDTKQAAVYVGRKSPETILRWIRQGLPAERRQGRYWVRREDLDSWLTK